MKLEAITINVKYIEIKTLHSGHVLIVDLETNFLNLENRSFENVRLS